MKLSSDGHLEIGKGVMLTQEELKAILSYDPETGIFTWLKTGKGIRLDRIAGNKLKSGYIQINIKCIKYYSHRLAWLYMTGEWPEDEIDHIDLDKANNKWINLRQATNSQNQHNRTCQHNNKFGMKGVTKKKNKNGYYSVIWHNNKPIHLGVFSSPEEAKQAYDDAALKLHGEYYCQ